MISREGEAIMRVIAIVGLAAFVGACAPTTTPQIAQHRPWNDEYKKAAADVGKTYWIKPISVLGVQVCDKPADTLDAKCDYVNAGKFTVQAIEQSGSRSYYRVAFDNGRVGYVEYFAPLDQDKDVTRADLATANPATR
jgi:hypothetical protein